LEGKDNVRDLEFVVVDVLSFAIDARSLRFGQRGSVALLLKILRHGTQKQVRFSM
jgi:hypothetical protein